MVLGSWVQNSIELKPSVLMLKQNIDLVELDGRLQKLTFWIQDSDWSVVPLKWTFSTCVSARLYTPSFDYNEIKHLRPKGVTDCMIYAERSSPDAQTLKHSYHQGFVFIYNEFVTLCFHWFWQSTRERRWIIYANDSGASETPSSHLNGACLPPLSSFCGSLRLIWISQTMSFLNDYKKQKKDSLDGVCVWVCVCRSPLESFPPTRWRYWRLKKEKKAAHSTLWHFLDVLAWLFKNYFTKVRLTKQWGPPGEERQKSRSEVERRWGGVRVF